MLVLRNVICTCLSVCDLVFSTLNPFVPNFSWSQHICFEEAAIYSVIWLSCLITHLFALSVILSQGTVKSFKGAAGCHLIVGLVL